MININIKKDYFAYITTDSKYYFNLLIKSFTRRNKEFNHFYKMYDYVDRKYYSLVNKGSCIKVKAGLISFLCKSLDKNKIAYKILDERERIILNRDFKIISHLSDDIKLRNYQLDAVKEVFKNPFGMIQLPTGTGKSEISAAIIKTYIYNYSEEAVVYLVPTIALQKDASNRFTKYGIDVNTKLPLKVSCVNIFTYMFMNRVGKDRFDYKQRNLVGAILYDEAQHLKGDKTSKIVHGFKNLRLNLGISATPSDCSDEYKKYLKELNSTELTVFGSTGKIVYMMQIDESISMDFVTPIEVHVAKFYDRFLNSDDEFDWYKIKQYHLKNEKRANFVANYVKHICDDANLNTVVLLIPEIEWSKLYMKCVKDVYKNESNVRCFELYGGNTIYEYKDNLENPVLLSTKEEKEEAMNAILNPNIRTIFSATTWFYEGVNIPNIQAVINCYGGRDSKRVKQQCGRAMRLFKDKSVAYIHEIEDVNNYVLMSQFTKRLGIYIDEYNADIIYSSFSLNEKG